MDKKVKEGLISQVKFMELLIDSWHAGSSGEWAKKLAMDLQAEQFDKIINKMKRNDGPFKIKNYKRERLS